MVIRENQFILNGRRFAWLEAGEGKVILILHGWGGSSSSYRDLMLKLADHGYRVIVPDLPGFGQSEAPPESGWQVDDYVKQLVNFVKKLNVNKIFLYAHSFGGRLAIKWAAERPKEIEKLILCGAAGLKPKLTLKKIIAWPVAKIGKIFFFIPPFNFFKPLVKKIFYRLLREQDYYQSNELKKTFIKITKEDLKSQLHKINVPTLIIWGAKDKYTPLKDGVIMNREIKNAKLAVIKNAGHGLHLKNPGQVVNLVINFIKPSPVRG